MKNPFMVGERVYLRAREVDDGEALTNGLTHDPETFFERGRYPVSPIAWEHYLEQSAKPGMPEDASFVVCLVATDEVIGTLNINHLDLINRTGETSSFLFAPYRNQGYGPEAKHLLLEYCFDHLHLHAICSHVWEPNTRSAAALKKQGYKFAGRLKWDDYKDGVYRDTLVFDLLREDWLEARDAWRQSRQTSR